jgi:cytochrome P450
MTAMDLTPLAVPASSRRPVASLPGPRAWPLVGNLPQLDAQGMHLQLERWVHEYGPMYRMKIGPREAVVVARPEVISHLLRDRPDGWRRMHKMQAVIREIGGHGLFSAEGDDWRRQRKLVMSAFDPAHLKRYFPSLVRVTQRLRTRLDGAARRGETMDLQTLLMRYTVDVTAGLAFGIDVNTQEQPDNAIQNHLDHVFPMLMKRIFAPLPWWRYLRLPSDRTFDRHLAKVHEAVAGYIRAARERIERNPQLQQQPANLLEALISARDDVGGGLSEQDIVGNVLTVLLAGEDTTANTLSWTLHLLHTHRDAWDRLVHEVDAALGGQNDMPRQFDIARGLEPIEHCIQEAMRLKPVAPFLLFECNKDTVLDGVALRAGSTVICLARHGAIDEGTAPDAAQFRPQRWAAAADDEADRSLMKASIPFGAGPRLCPGRYLAMLEMKMVLATIARNFELVDVCTDDGAPPAERLEFTMSPVGLRMRLRARR